MMIRPHTHVEPILKHKHHGVKIAKFTPYIDSKITEMNNFDSGTYPL